MFKLYENLIITQKREKIPYVKRSAQKEKSKQEDKIIPEFYSKREWEMLTNDTMLTKQ
jgi:hypothetical protein